MDYLVLLTGAAESAGTEGSVMGGMLGTLLPLGLMIVMIYFLFMRPESKRKKQMAEMLGNIQIADEVVTSGGIIGRVIDAKPDADTIVIETGGDKTRIRILKSYIIENRTVHE
ncbi:MAG: preprotein translocase subunit YajC [Oscillospiraceae bacterium]|nr:preprotein translocase subunit YajC [Oscillospiraceae bacterium]